MSTYEEHYNKVGGPREPDMDLMECTACLRVGMFTLHYWGDREEEWWEATCKCGHLVDEKYSVRILPHKRKNIVDLGISAMEKGEV